MTRVRALFVSALMAIAPVMGAVCANACHAVTSPVAAQAAASCEHSESRDTGTSLSAADCSIDRDAFVYSGFRTAADAARLPADVPRFVSQSRSDGSLERPLRLLPPPLLRNIALRI